MSTIRAPKRRQRKQQLRRRQREIARRLKHRSGEERTKPVFEASNIHYQLADRTSAVDTGGIGAMHLLARQVGLGDAIDENLRLLKIHQPYFESDHVLNIAYNALCGGFCLEDIELRRQNKAYLDALGATRIPDPTTTGDFCRRFTQDDVVALMYAINTVQVRLWRRQPEAFFEEAVLEADGVMTPTTGACKAGMDISYKGEWGYHPLVITLANTGEVLFVVNRSGNRPSHEQAAEYLDKRRRCAARRGSSVCVSAATRTSRRRVTWTAGRRRVIAYLDAGEQFARQQAARCGGELAEGFRQHLGHGYPQENVLAEELKKFVRQRCEK